MSGTYMYFDHYVPRPETLPLNDGIPDEYCLIITSEIDLMYYTIDYWLNNKNNYY